MAARPSIGNSTEPQRLRVDRLFLTKGSVDAADSLSCAYQSRRSPPVCESPPPHDATTAAGIHVMSLTLAAEEKDASTVQVFRG